MDDNIFDQYADLYNNTISENIGYFGKKISYYAEHKSIVISQNTKLIPRSILEYGCGIGRNIGFLTSYFPTATVEGYDISEKSLMVAKSIHQNIPFLTPHSIANKSASYNIVLVANVLHHTDPENRVNDLRLIYSLLKENGELFIIEHNPFNFLTRQAVATCPFDIDAKLLPLKESCEIAKQAGFQIINKEYTLFFPSSLRFFQPLENLLSRIPLGAQYYVHAVKCSSNLE
jgi:SAM-dependent methyltransferase